MGQHISYAGGGPARAMVTADEFDPLTPGTGIGLFDVKGTGCAAADVAAGASGKIALIDRGVCPFSQKVANAKAKGAVGVIIVNSVAGDPIGMASTAGFDDDLPAVMISRNDGLQLHAVEPSTVDVAAGYFEFITDNGDIQYDSSSQGPTFVDFAVKPDLTSVAVNVLSALPCSFAAEGASCGGEGTWDFFSGTSMATPHIAGSAAVLLDIHPGWSPARVKSALVNTADRVVTDAFRDTNPVGPRAQGAGRQDLTEASKAKVSFTPASASFGKISGSQVNATAMTIEVTNHASSSRTFDITEVRFNPGVTDYPGAYNAGTTATGDDRIDTPGSITIAAGATAQLLITVRPGYTGLIQGWLDLDGPAAEDYSIAYMILVP